MLPLSAAAIPSISPLPKFEEFFEINLNSEEVESIGGFALKKFGHLPKVGESFEDYDLRFTVTSADQRKIKKITVLMKR